MQKKSFWKRTNRGFIVSMALLVLILAYVVTSVLMLLPEKRAIRTIADTVRDMAEAAFTLSTEEVAALTEDVALQAEHERLAEELRPLFVADADYLDNAADALIDIVRMRTSGLSQAASLSDREVDTQSCRVEEDTASYTVDYEYTASGEFVNYNDQVFTGDDVEHHLTMTIILQKQGDVWKIYRIEDLQMFGYYY